MEAEHVIDGRLKGRSPYGERGLKYVRELHGLLIAQSLSLRRAWIEIKRVSSKYRSSIVALLTESVD